MMHLIRRYTPEVLALTMALCVIVPMVGCGEEEPPPKKKEVKRQPPPPPPVTTIEAIAAELQIDTYIVRWAEEDAPASSGERRGVLIFFDAWVRGDAQTVKSMLGAADQAELQRMIDDGQWAQATKAIDGVDLRLGRSARGDNCVLAIYEVGLGFQPQLWNFTGSGDRMAFEAVATPPNMMDRLHGDMITSWWEELDNDKKLWGIPDEQLDDLLAEEDDERDAAKSGGGHVGPAAGGSGPRRPGGGRRGPAGR
jgi:hypothetical protein